MESKGIGSASAPSYDEAMKCSPVPPNQMHPYPGHMMEQHPGHMMQPYPMQSYPMQQHQPMMQQAPAPAPSPVVQQPIVQTFNIGGGMSLPPTCGSCSKPLHTRVGYVSTCSTHLACLLCCLFFCWPCAPFVYCTKSCREPRLECVNCGARI